jgi:hypothetical protein
VMLKQEDFKAILLEGTFKVPSATGESGLSSVLTARGVHIDVDTTLNDLVGDHVQLALHAIPEHLSYDSQVLKNLVNFSQQGVLQREGPRWFLRKFDGSLEEVPLPSLDGKMGRLLAATIHEVEKMRDCVTKADLDSLGTEIHDLKGKLEELREISREK